MSLSAAASSGNPAAIQAFSGAAKARAANVRLWHLADNRGTAIFCPLLEYQRANSDFIAGSFVR